MDHLPRREFITDGLPSVTFGNAIGYLPQDALKVHPRDLTPARLEEAFYNMNDSLQEVRTDSRTFAQLSRFTAITVISAGFGALGILVDHGKEKLSRRDFLRYSALIFGLSLTACGGGITPAVLSVEAGVIPYPPGFSPMLPQLLPYFSTLATSSSLDIAVPPMVIYNDESSTGDPNQDPCKPEFPEGTASYKMVDSKGNVTRRYFTKDGDLIGHIELGQDPLSERIISYVHVEKNYRGQGYATKFLLQSDYDIINNQKWRGAKHLFGDKNSYTYEKLHGCRQMTPSGSSEEWVPQNVPPPPGPHGFNNIPLSSPFYNELEFYQHFLYPGVEIRT